MSRLWSPRRLGTIFGGDFAYQARRPLFVMWA